MGSLGAIIASIIGSDGLYVLYYDLCDGHHGFYYGLSVKAFYYGVYRALLWHSLKIGALSPRCTCLYCANCARGHIMRSVVASSSTGTPLSILPGLCHYGRAMDA